MPKECARKVTKLSRQAGPGKGPESTEGRGEARTKVGDGDPALLHGIPFAQRDRSVFQRLEIHRDAEGGARMYRHV